LAAQINVSEKHMSKLMGGDVQLTISLAVAIERALPELTAEGLLLIDMVQRVALERTRP
jgi:plasmid maintenance system antidote protein VapI